MVSGRSNGKVKNRRLMLRWDAANERLQKINPAALWGEASKMECRLPAPNGLARAFLEGRLLRVERK
jgi:hypothetical protein